MSKRVLQMVVPPFSTPLPPPLLSLLTPFSAGRRAVSQQVSPRDIAEYERTHGSVGKRRFASMKREDYRSSPGQPFSQSFTESSPRKEPKKGNFHLTPDKSSTVDLGDVGKRKFSSIKREDYRNRRTSTDIPNQGPEPANPQPGIPTQAPAPTPTPSPHPHQPASTPGKRAFASLPRTDYRNRSASSTEPPVTSPAKPIEVPVDNISKPAVKEEVLLQSENTSSSNGNTTSIKAGETNGTEGSEVGRRRFSSIQRVDYRGRTANRSSTNLDPSATTDKQPEESNESSAAATAGGGGGKWKEAKKGNFALSPDKAATLDLGEVPRKRLADDLLKKEEEEAGVANGKSPAAADSSPSSSEDNVPRRRFASMKREDYRNSQQPSSPQLTTPPAAATISPSPTPTASPSTQPPPATEEAPKMRKFAAMKREHYKTLNGPEVKEPNGEATTSSNNIAQGGKGKKKKKKISTLTKKKPPKPTKDK